MELLSITQVSLRYKVSRKTVDNAVQKKWLNSLQNLRQEHLILNEEAEFYFNGPPFPYWWSFQQIASLGIPITLLYSFKDRYEFDYQLWKKNLYAYVAGNKGIEKVLKELGFLVNAKPMIQMEEPTIE